MEHPLNIGKDAKIFVAGHLGLVGSAITRKLQALGFKNLLLRSRRELDLTDQFAVRKFFEMERPEYVFLAAGKVGGVMANHLYRGDFILQNLQIETNVIGSAWEYEVKKLVFLGSSCIYPRMAPQPMAENALLAGPLEYTNEAYAVAKIAGIMLCKSLMIQYSRSFISLMPTNLYGPGDHYDLQNSHVLPAMIRKFHEAKVQRQPAVTMWGTGSPFREFLYSDDIANAAWFCFQNYNEVEHINVGYGEEITIRNLAELIQKIVGFKGDVVWDNSKPDGTPRKLIDSAKLRSLGWKPSISLEEGIPLAYADFVRRHGTSEASQATLPRDVQRHHARL